MSDEQKELGMDLYVYPVGSTDVSIRRVGLGLQAAILIEPVKLANGEVGLEVHSSLLTQEEAHGIISLVDLLLTEGEQG